MTVLNIIIATFVLLELFNVMILYIKPSIKLGNGVGVFNAYFESQNNSRTRMFVKYLINWVANVKLVFIALLIVILFTGTETVKLYSCFALIVSIAVFYISLYPIIKKLDDDGFISPKGYSKTLFVLITGFILMFIAGITMYFL